MIAQLILTAGLSCCLFYVLSLGRSQPIVRFGLFALAFSGYAFIWMPELTNEIARWVGIGRGADLLFYTWILISLFLILRLHLLLRSQNEKLTELARHAALSAPRRPDRAQAN